MHHQAPEQQYNKLEIKNQGKQIHDLQDLEYPSFMFIPQFEFFIKDIGEKKYKK